MPTGSALNTYHILCTVDLQPCLLRIRAINGKDALTRASRNGTNLVILFATRQVEISH